MFLALTAIPASIVGAALWYLAGTLPGCAVAISERLTSPDQRFDLVVFSRQCGGSGQANTQAALIPVGEELPEDVASFVSIGASADLQPQWGTADRIVLSLPAGASIFRQDASVPGVGVVYR